MEPCGPRATLQTSNRAAIFMNAATMSNRATATTRGSRFLIGFGELVGDGAGHRVAGA
jgi:hypothetical protein